MLFLRGSGCLENIGKISKKKVSLFLGNFLEIFP